MIEVVNNSPRHHVGRRTVVDVLVHAQRVPRVRRAVDVDGVVDVRPQATEHAVHAVHSVVHENFVESGDILLW